MTTRKGTGEGPETPLAGAEGPAAGSPDPETVRALRAALENELEAEDRQENRRCFAAAVLPALLGFHGRKASAALAVEAFDIAEAMMAEDARRCAADKAAEADGDG